jgi:hypothetical protein
VELAEREKPTANGGVLGLSTKQIRYLKHSYQDGNGLFNFRMARSMRQLAVSVQR